MVGVGIVELNVPAQVSLLGDGVVDLVPLDTVLEAKEKAAATVGGKFAIPLMVWHLSMSDAPKGVELCKVRGVPGIELERDLVAACLGGPVVEGVGCESDSFGPPPVVHVSPLEHSTGAVEEGLILALGHAVLLRSVRNAVLQLNPPVVAPLLHEAVDELPPAICAHNPDEVAMLSLLAGCPMVEGGEGVRLPPER